MMSLSKYVIPFEKLRKKDVEIVGGKNANLGELISIGIPVPPGFAITAEAYKLHIERNNLADKISSILSNLDIMDSTALESASKKIREIIESGEIPEEVKTEILEAYRELGRKVGRVNPVVAVRSSATAEDLTNCKFCRSARYIFICRR
jgi:pyruvate,water dikinase